MRIIINADDLGISQAVNDAIFGLMADGKITSATILANGPAVADAASRLAKFPNCSFGVHLNLTEFRPLAAEPALARIMNRDGDFAGSIRSVRIDRDLRHAIFAEWCAQVVKLLSVGVRLSHIDSHQHVHTIAGLLPVIKGIQQKFALKKVRTTKNIYAPHSGAGFMLLLKKRLWTAALRSYCSAITTDAFTSFLDFCEAVKSTRVRCQTVELMTHPGALHSANETKALRELWLDRLPFQASLISYENLQAPPCDKDMTS